MHLIGHRGAPRIAPANTMSSFRAAHRIGCDWVECDCRASADGVIVLAHDPTVTDHAGRFYRVSEHRAVELAALDLGVGDGVPRLDELVAWAADRVGVMADVKDEGREGAIGAALAPMPRASCIVSGASEEGRARFRSLAPGLPLSLTLSAGQEDELTRRWPSFGADALTLEHPLVTPGRVAGLHGLGLRVYAWTVDDLDRLRSLAAMGVDGLISNRADLLARL